MQRLIARPVFTGPVVPRTGYVLVDDVTTMGGTLAELANHIQHGGGKVIGVVTLTNATRTGTMMADAALVTKLERRFGDAIRADFNIEPSALTAAEAQYLGHFRDADALRARRVASRKQRAHRLSAKGLSGSQDSTGSEQQPERLTDLAQHDAGDSLDAVRKPSTPRIPVDPIRGKAATPLTDILLEVSSGTGQRLTKAKLGRGTLGTYFPGSTATTIRYAGDLDTTAHELAHALDDKFGIVKDWANQPTSPFDTELRPFAEHGSIQTSGPRATPKYVRAEGVAEWFRAWLVNPTKAEAAAPQFAKHALAKLDASTRAALDQFSTDIRTHAGATAHEKTMANVQWEAPKSSALDWLSGGKQPGFNLTWADKASAELTDRLQPFVKAIDFARKQRGLGQRPLPANDPEVLVRLYSGIHAKMDQIFEKGMIDATGKHVTKGGLQWLIDPLDKTALDAEMQEVASYMISQRTIERIGKGPRCFNPRPPRRTGATPGLPSRAVPSHRFQSSPAPKDGRYSVASVTCATVSGFQSSPAPKDGRYAAASRCRRKYPCFNPRPPRRTGATLSRGNYSRFSLFQSSPAPKDGRYADLLAETMRTVEFQSSPAPKDGRYLARS